MVEKKFEYIIYSEPSQTEGIVNFTSKVQFFFLTISTIHQFLVIFSVVFYLLLTSSVPPMFLLSYTKSYPLRYPTSVWSFLFPLPPLGLSLPDIAWLTEQIKITSWIT